MYLCPFHKTCGLIIRDKNALRAHLKKKHNIAIEQGFSVNLYIQQCKIKTIEI